MNATQIKNTVGTDTRVRISEHSDWAAGAEGVVIGYRAYSDTVAVGFVNEAGAETGETIQVPRTAVEQV